MDIFLTESDIDRFWAKVQVGSPVECWEWLGGRNPNGYGSLGVQGKTLGAHRISYLINTGDQPGKRVIRHHCDNPGCVNPYHLAAGTQHDNVMDMVERGRHRRGCIKLTDIDVVNIFTRYWQSNALKATLAREYSIHPTHVLCIANGKTWSKVLDPIAHIREQSKRFQLKFSEEQIREICLRYRRDNLSTTELARIYNTCPETVGNIAFGRTWTELTQDIRSNHPTQNDRWKLLNADMAKEIYIRFVVNKEKRDTIAGDYDIAPTLVSRIKNGTSWAAATQDLRAKYPPQIKKKRILTANDACEIYQLWKTGLTQAEIAKKFGISESAISNIAAGKTWKQATKHLRIAS